MSTNKQNLTTNQTTLATSIIKTYDQLLLANQSNQPSQAHHTIIESLNLIKNYLIGASIGGPDTDPGIKFIKLQNQVEFNASLVLLRWLSQTLLHPAFSSSNNEPSNTNSDPGNHLHHSQLINQLSKTFVILQGLLHLHPPSRRLFASEFNLKILLSFLPLALHSSKFSPIALPLLDLLLITFVDSPVNAQLFESAGGLEILVQAMKQKSLKTELRVKVLETLWAWWIDEEEGTSPDAPFIPPSMAPAHPSPNLNPAFPTDLSHHRFSAPSIHQPVISFNNPPSSQTSQKRSRPSFSPTELHNHASETPNHNQTRGNSRMRPISLPPPSLSEQTPDITLANLSEGHESPMRKSSKRSPMSPSANSGKSLVKAQFAFTQTGPTPTPSPVMMVKSSSEGSKLNDTHSRPGTSWDPASRLRTMLENTAGEFIPATPHHPRRVQPVTYTDHSNSPCREPHVLHKSHPTPQNKRLARNDSQHQLISEQSSTKPSDESEDSDRLDISPHRLFAVRQRRTAIKQSNNTPQRLIRHKQSASLGSIQHQFQPGRSPKARTQLHQSSGEESKSASGSEPEGQLGRSRDRTVRPISSSHPSPPRSTTSSDNERPFSPDHHYRTSSNFARFGSLLESSTPIGEASARRKMSRVDEPSTVRPNRITKAITPIPGSSGKLNTATRDSSPTVKSSHKQEGGLKAPGQDKNMATPIRSSRGKSTISMPLTTMMTPTVTRRNPGNGDSDNNQDNKNRTTVTGLNLTPNPSLVTAAHKRLLINQPLTPNKSLINQADLESMVNGTDSDASIALSPRKDVSCSTPSISQLQKKKTLKSAKKLRTSKTNDQIHDDDGDDEDQVALAYRGSSAHDKNEKEKKTAMIPSLTKDSSKPQRTNGNNRLKTGILEKYMANSDELVRSFKEIGVGFSLLNHRS